MLLADCDIRPVLKHRLIEKFAGTNTIIVDELPICWGDGRIDIAVVNSSFYGYEIKSDRDTLARLPRQIELYNKMFDYITLICSPRLLTNARDLIPNWWGIVIPYPDKDISTGIRFEIEREPVFNDNVDVRSLVELTWKKEAINILAKRGLARGYRSKPRWDIWDRIVEIIEPEEIKDAVRTCLRSRQGWRKAETLHRLYAD